MVVFHVRRMGLAASSPWILRSRGFCAQSGRRRPLFFLGYGLYIMIKWISKNSRKISEPDSRQNGSMTVDNSWDFYVSIMNQSSSSMWKYNHTNINKNWDCSKYWQFKARTRLVPNFTCLFWQPPNRSGQISPYIGMIYEVIKWCGARIDTCVYVYIYIHMYIYIVVREKDMGKIWKFWYPPGDVSFNRHSKKPISNIIQAVLQRGNRHINFHESLCWLGGTSQRPQSLSHPSSHPICLRSFWMVKKNRNGVFPMAKHTIGCKAIKIYTWLVVWTPLKNISQLGWLFPIYGKIIQMFQTTNQIVSMISMLKNLPSAAYRWPMVTIF